MVTSLPRLVTSYLFLSSIAHNRAEDNPETPIPLVTFKKDETTNYKFVLENDPVMGGQSHSSYQITNDTFRWNGEVVNVPKLDAPGFCSVKSLYLIGRDNVMNDASACTHLKLRVGVSSTPDYAGFKVSFSSFYTENHTFKSFKANFAVKGLDFDEGGAWVDIPFEDFSNDWSPYTGDAVTTCKDDPAVCPTAKDLSTIKQITIWAEGVSGGFSLDVLGIYAGFAPTKNTPPPPPPPLPTTETTCSGPIQENLRFNISLFTADEILPYYPEDEGLAYAVCCDSDFAGYAEPREFYSDPDVSFFDHLDDSLPNTFYDPVCGIPLFVVPAPGGRSLEDFYDETVEHGWPSFREMEVVDGNVVVADDGRIVLSACGTRLGTMEPDEEGARYCLDTACISGHAAAAAAEGGGFWNLMKRTYFRSPRASFVLE